MARLIIFATLVSFSLLLPTHASPINVEEMLPVNQTSLSAPYSHSQKSPIEVKKRTIHILAVGITNDINVEEVKELGKREIGIDNQNEKLVNRFQLDQRNNVWH